MRYRSSRLSLAATAALLTAPLAGAQSYQLVDLGALEPEADSWAFAINDFGQVVGTSKLKDGREAHGFVWENGQLVDLGVLDGGFCGGFSFGNAINDAGVVAGTAVTCGFPLGGQRRPVIHQGTEFEDLGFGPSRNFCRDIDNAGRVVGATGVGEVVVDRIFLHAFLWDDGTLTDLGTLGGDFSQAMALNEAGQIVGGAHTPDNEQYHAFLYEKDRMVDLGTLGGRQSEAHDVNELRQIVGWAEDASGARRAFLYESGSMRDLGTLGGRTAEAHAINSAGLVVGESRGPAGRSRAFVYDPVTGQLHALSDLLTTRDFAPLVARDVNDAGQIVGWGKSPDGEIRAFLADPVGAD